MLRGNALRRLTLPVLLLVVAIGAVAMRSEPSRVGVVDLNRLFEESARRDQLQEELTAFTKSLEARLAEINAKLAPLEEQLELSVKGTTQHQQLEKQVFGLVQEKKFEIARFDEEFKKRKLALREQLLGEIRAAVKSYGETHGYAAIIQREFTLPEATGLSWESVLYHDAGADLTDAILQTLDGK